MNIIKVVKNLNIIKNTLLEDGNKVNFIYEKDKNSLRRVFKKFTYNRVCFICSKESFSLTGEFLIKEAETAECKVGKKLLDNVSPTLQNAIKLSLLPEDIRAIITDDYSAVELLLYVCQLRKIPLIYRAKSLRTDGILSANVSIMNRGSREKYGINIDRYIILSNENVDADLPFVYSSLASKITAYYDYRVYNLVNKRVMEIESISVAVNGIRSIFGYKAKKNKDDICFFLYNGFKVELANLSVSGKFLDCASVSVARLMLSSRGKISGGALIDIISKTIRLCDIAFSNKLGALPEVPDYNERVNVLSNELYVEEKKALAGLVLQQKQLNDYKYNIINLTNELKTDIGELVKIIPIVTKTFESLGGEKTENVDDVNFAVMHSGDYPLTFNMMTIVRENGLLEYLK